MQFPKRHPEVSAGTGGPVVEPGGGGGSRGALPPLHSAATGAERAEGWVKDPDDILSLGLQIAQSRSCLYTLSAKVGIYYILGAIGYGGLNT